MAKGKAPEPLKHWQTWWSIGGPKLPDAEIIPVPGLSLARLTEDQFQQSKNEFRQVLPRPQIPNEEFVMHIPPKDEVHSRYRLQIDVMANGEEEAARIAQQHVDRLLISLSLVIPDARYFAELRKLRVLGEPGEMSAWSPSYTAFILGGTVPLDDDEIKRTFSVMGTLGKDATAENSYVHLLSAWRLQETSGPKPLQRSILQHYVLCIESVVSGFMTGIRKADADKIRAREREFANEFAEGFTKRADKPRAIRDAMFELNKIGLTHIIPSIEHTADALGISKSVRDDAIELYKFRSKRLSHPGRPKEEDLEKWLGAKNSKLCLADTIARNFLDKYCEWRR
ncbi:hypothetical protein [Sphingomonas daechungensis]|uniref:hypothetical protein n=1 Tax=Sphingomonas daechungensis TaxID=1176646 RepID=UPI00378348BB